MLKKGDANKNVMALEVEGASAARIEQAKKSEKRFATLAIVTGLQFLGFCCCIMEIDKVVKELKK